MREIKFRAWDKASKEMIYDNTKQKILWIYYRHTYEQCEDRFILMQYTGLDDRKGREIYEGDIVLQINDKEPSEVWWNDFVSGFEFVKKNGDCWMPNDDTVEYRYKVIGNIYENPELFDD